MPCNCHISVIAPVRVNLPMLCCDINIRNTCSHSHGNIDRQGLFKCMYGPRTLHVMSAVYRALTLALVYCLGWSRILWHHAPANGHMLTPRPHLE